MNFFVLLGGLFLCFCLILFFWIKKTKKEEVGGDKTERSFDSRFFFNMDKSIFLIFLIIFLLMPISWLVLLLREELIAISIFLVGFLGIICFALIIVLVIGYKRPVKRLR